MGHRHVAADVAWLLLGKVFLVGLFCEYASLTAKMQCLLVASMAEDGRDQNPLSFRADQESAVASASMLS